MEDNRFYDLRYDVWRSGRNPDNLSRDDFDTYLVQGYHPEEITANMMLPKKKRSEDESI
jgi:hypothetical protein